MGFFSLRVAGLVGLRVRSLSCLGGIGMGMGMGRVADATQRLIAAEWVRRRVAV